jgi:hypothetical protein
MRTALCLLLLAVSARAQFVDKDAEKPAAAPASPALPSGALPAAEVDTAQGGPTVVCDGKGGYAVDMKGKAVLLHGSCLRAHEDSHVADLAKTCPDGCKGQAAGTPHPWDNKTGRCPAFKDDLAFWTWRVGSECRAYSAERVCLRDLFEKAAKDDKGKVRARVKSVRQSLAYWRARGKELTPVIACPEPEFN